eukprot:8546609-Alexandrium_andersonii.AAC.1
MSASLVGSEMCIRDRRRRPPPSQRRARQQGVAPSPILKDEGTESVTEAVSYTHLTLPTICSV